MTGISIWVEEADAVAAMRRLIETLSVESLSGWMESEMLPFLRDRTKKRFEGEGDDAVGEWQPLAAATIAIRESKGFPAGPINHRTGELEDFITKADADITPFGTGVQMSYPADNGLEETLYQKLVTAQKGAPGQNGMSATPARPVIGLSETDLRFAEQSLAEFILAAQGVI